MLSTQSTKICLMAGLFVSTFILSMLPIKLLRAAQHSMTHREIYKSVLSILSCYAAGVFFATCLLDLFPAVEDKMTKALDRVEIYTSYPIPEFLLAFGFFFILVVEQLVLASQDSHDNAPEEGENAPLIDDRDSPGDSPMPPQRSHHQSGINASGSFSADPSFVYDDISVNVNSLTESTEHHETVTDVIPPKDQAYQDPASHSILRSVMLLLALSLHSIFEGLAVGLQDSTDTVLQIFTALMIHKSILAFSLGLNLVQSKMKLAGIIRSNFIFSLTSPLGIAIGIAIDHFTSPYSFGANMTNAVLQGIACGTFIYIVFFEILPHEFNSLSTKPNRLLKVLFLILGFGTIAVVMLVLPDEVDTKPVGGR